MFGHLNHSSSLFLNGRTIITWRQAEILLERSATIHVLGTAGTQARFSKS